MILPFSIIERIDFFKSLGPCYVSDEIIKKLANNKNIYYEVNKPFVYLPYIKDNALYYKECICGDYHYNEDINNPFMVYQLYETYIRGFYIKDYMYEYNYIEFIIKTGIHRDRLLSEILDNE